MIIFVLLIRVPVSFDLYKYPTEKTLFYNYVAHPMESGKGLKIVFFF